MDVHVCPTEFSIPGVECFWRMWSWDQNFVLLVLWWSGTLFVHPMERPRQHFRYCTYGLYDNGWYGLYIVHMCPLMVWYVLYIVQCGLMKAPLMVWYVLYIVQCGLMKADNGNQTCMVCWHVSALGCSYVDYFIFGSLVLGHLPWYIAPMTGAREGL
jgi:hypothetical protein